MGSRKVSAEKKKKERTNFVASKPKDLSVKPSVNEIDVIFGKKKRRSAPENLDTPEEDGIGSQPSSQSKKKKKMTLPIDEEGRVKGGKQSKGGKGVKSSNSAEAGKAGKAGISSMSGEPGSKARKKTADGLTVYGEDELKWNTKDAGGTELCPFDCECCF